MPTRELRAGDWVEVRSREEILATLDASGCRDALPFMPEMLAHCGRRYRVFKSAHKGCDTIYDWKTMRRMNGAVHLEGVRCDGGAHGGCQAGCLLYWKTDWLRPVSGPEAGAEPVPSSASSAGTCTIESLTAATRAGRTECGEETYRCQATEHARATKPLAWWDPRPYVKDLTSGNVKPLAFFRYVLQAAYNVAARRFLGGRTRPYVKGLVQGKTPIEPLDLQPGELVRVRPADEIMRTIKPDRKNRGLTFDVEMIPYCGRTFRVLQRVEKLINERTGAMMQMPNDCIILDGVTCSGCLSQYRLFCPRAIYPFWREIWLRRAE